MTYKSIKLKKIIIIRNYNKLLLSFTSNLIKLKIALIMFNFFKYLIFLNHNFINGFLPIMSFLFYMIGGTVLFFKKVVL